ncbi:unnamed protein product [Zymoseptoria tritici ST99CH_3D7]|uniref:Uncharacterized protein n=1 Tax=Zymoseptoria tritici (strain ST99CH_3D7) TaxID=1276538 RepID=A0A1X7RZQ7_ZYMT9|nr:unnamed protein product [Zymoseptoria tritici ST99CH_3D7]
MASLPTGLYVPTNERSPPAKGEPSRRRRKMKWPFEQTGEVKQKPVEYGPDTKPADQGMSAVWQKLPVELATIIIVKTAVIPLEIYAALEPQNWQQVRNALAISVGVRQDVIRALNDRGAIESDLKVPVHQVNWGREPRPPNTEPSRALLNHFGWLPVALRNKKLYGAYVKVHVWAPFPGPDETSEVERIVVPAKHREGLELSDSQVQELMASICSKSNSYKCGRRLLDIEGAWGIRPTARDISNARKLLVREEDPSTILQVEQYWAVLHGGRATRLN